MTAILRTLRAQWAGFLALAIAVTGVTAAATGQSMKLGMSNEANKPTLVRNTGSGAALDLRVEPGKPPLAVNSSKLVHKLNAAQLGGKGPRAFAPATGSPSYAPATGSPNYAAAGSSYTKAQSDSRYRTYAGAPGYQPLVLTPILYGIIYPPYEQVFLNESFVAPVGQRLYVLFAGNVTGELDTNIEIRITVAGIIEDSCPIAAPSDLADCRLYYESAVSAGTPLSVKVELIRSGTSSAGEVSGTLAVYTR